jgi:hypothetical protein
MIEVRPLLAAAVSVSLWSTPVFSESLPRSARSEIYSFLETSEVVGDFIDEMSNGGLSQFEFEITVEALEGEVSRYGASWWEVFGLILTTEKVLTRLSEGDFQGALATSGTYAAKSMISRTLIGQHWSRGTNLTGVAILTLEIYMDAYVDLVDDRGFYNQWLLYQAARKGMSHQGILAAKNDPIAGIYFSRNGYLTDVNDFSPPPDAKMVLTQPTTRLQRNVVMELYRAAYEADSLSRQLRSAKRQAIQEFLREISVSTAPVSPEANVSVLDGVWTGYASSGSTRLDYRWVVYQSGKDVSGTIALKMPSESEWSTYVFGGTFEDNVLTFSGRGWISRGNGSFCLANGVLRFETSGGTASLTGTWGPDANPNPSGCPRGASGGIGLTRQ